MRTFVFLSGLLWVALFVGVILFFNPRWILVSEDPAEKADAIVIFMGEVVHRSNKALELYRKGMAPKIVFVRPENGTLAKLGMRKNKADLVFEYLVHQGVAIGDILYDETSAVHSSRSEAARLKTFLKNKLPKAERLLVVSSWYHTGRLRWTLTDSAFAEAWDVSMQPALHGEYGPSNWLRHENSFLSVFTEYLKFAYNVMT